MGYTTTFSGSFEIDKPVDDETYNLLQGLASTRRMKRDIRQLGRRVYVGKVKRVTKEIAAQWEKEFGVEGEFWVGDSSNSGQDSTPDIIDYNNPPKTQPGLWCQWAIQEDRQTIEWDGGEKFYHYTEWIKYLIEKVLAPRGYTLSGTVTWQGEDDEDAGQIDVANNVVTEKWRVSFYLSDEDAGRVTRIVDDYLNDPLKEVIDHKLDGGK